MELIGLRAAPKTTLETLKHSLHGHFQDFVVTLITDWQDARHKARYAVWVRHCKPSVLTYDAFGPAFGPDGAQSLALLVGWLQEKGVTHFYETVVAPSEYSALFSLEPHQAEQRLLASANPTDPAIYR